MVGNGGWEMVGNGGNWWEKVGNVLICLGSSETSRDHAAPAGQKR
jgi:hypothetical protein